MPRNTTTHPRVITCLFWRCWDVVIQVEVRSDKDMTSHMVLFRTMGFRRTGMSCAASGPHHRPILDVMQSTARWRSLRKIKINRIYFKNSVKPLQVLTCTIMIKIDCRLFNFPKKIFRFRSFTIAAEGLHDFTVLMAFEQGKVFIVSYLGALI